jgi:hypothetical protein
MACFCSMGKLSRALRCESSAAVSPLAILVLEVSSLNWGRDPTLPLALPLNVWSEREDLYYQAADFLRGKVSKQDLVAASEIGALGYSCDCRILDTVGLVSPGLQDYYPLRQISWSGTTRFPPTSSWNAGRTIW